jgi:Fanconi-associated nuclease 1
MRLAILGKNNARTPGFGIRKEQIGRIEGAKVVKRIWEGVWPIWKLLVEGDGADAVDAKEDKGGLVGDRFKTGESLSIMALTSLIRRSRFDSYRLQRGDSTWHTPRI